MVHRRGASFLDSARRDGDPLYAAYVLVLVCGLRKGEVLGLTRDDLDLDAAELTIGRQLQRVRRELLHRETKIRASDATLPLPARCVTALRHRAASAPGRRRPGSSGRRVGVAAHRRAFCSVFGTPIDPRNFNRSWDARCAKAGVRKITVHDARRTCGSLLVDLDPEHPAGSHEERGPAPSCHQLGHDGPLTWAPGSLPLVRELVVVDVVKRWREFSQDHLPDFSQGSGGSRLGRHPVAQASLGRAAPGWSRWSAPPDVRPGPAGRGLVASGVRWVAVLGRTSQSRPGPGAEPRPPEAVPRVVGRRPCPPEATPLMRRRTSGLDRRHDPGSAVTGYRGMERGHDSTRAAAV